MGVEGHVLPSVPFDVFERDIDHQGVPLGVLPALAVVDPPKRGLDAGAEGCLRGPLQGRAEQFPDSPPKAHGRPRLWCHLCVHLPQVERAFVVHLAKSEDVVVICPCMSDRVRGAHVDGQLARQRQLAQRGQLQQGGLCRRPAVRGWVAPLIAIEDGGKQNVDLPHLVWHEELAHAPAGRAASIKIQLLRREQRQWVRRVARRNVQLEVKFHKRTRCESLGKSKVQLHSGRHVPEHRAAAHAQLVLAAEAAEAQRDLLVVVLGNRIPAHGHAVPGPGLERLVRLGLPSAGLGGLLLLQQLRPLPPRPDRQKGSFAEGCLLLDQAGGVVHDAEAAAEGQEREPLGGPQTRGGRQHPATEARAWAAAGTGPGSCGHQGG
mmetsp:Transcript_100640/g.285153  ORF Transcript_100640/g.285153 Transcript_100640/m.285153 type:complete len:377 (-) Transcript_100640:30-1160(-)